MIISLLILNREIAIQLVALYTLVVRLNTFVTYQQEKYAQLVRLFIIESAIVEVVRKCIENEQFRKITTYYVSNS